MYLLYNIFSTFQVILLNATSLESCRYYSLYLNLLALLENKSCVIHETENIASKSHKPPRNTVRWFWTWDTEWNTLNTLKPRARIKNPSRLRGNVQETVKLQQVRDKGELKEAQFLNENNLAFVLPRTLHDSFCESERKSVFAIPNWDNNFTIERIVVVDHKVSNDASENDAWKRSWKLRARLSMVMLRRTKHHFRKGNSFGMWVVEACNEILTFTPVTFYLVEGLRIAASFEKLSSMLNEAFS